jgi:hypothetical protein
MRLNGRSSPNKLAVNTLSRYKKLKKTDKHYLASIIFIALNNKIPPLE